jgi:hypothetical protein
MSLAAPQIGAHTKEPHPLPAYGGQCPYIQNEGNVLFPLRYDGTTSRHGFDGSAGVLTNVPRVSRCRP